MSLSNPNKPVTEQRLQEFYHKIAPYMGGGGGGTGGGGHTIEDGAGTELTQRDTLQFGDGFNTTDDSENEKTVVEPNLMTAADMDDVVTPLPSVQSRYHKYSTEEQIVAEWIDGKPIWQKTISCGTLPNNTAKTISLGLDNIDIIYIVNAFTLGEGLSLNMPYAHKSGIKNQIQIYLDIQNRNVVISTAVDMSDFIGYVTVQYTKSTS